MKTIFKKALSFIFASFLAITASAQYSTDFRVTEVADDELAANIDLVVSGLLTAFNNAQMTNDVPRISGLDVTPEVEQTIMKLWKDCPFRCRDKKIAERAIKTPHGEYQVRNIPLIMVPIEGESKDPSWKVYQEAVFTIDKTGMVTDFRLALDASLYINVMNKARDVEDVIQRQLILEYVERFRNAYNLKDLNFLDQIFSEDALIITGKVIKTVKSDVKINNTKIKYNRQDKKTYLTNLANVFKQNKRINVIFDEIKVVKHSAKKGYYGVTLKQGWSSDNYSDVGYLFLLWDFTNPDAPQIHVRTWQPEEYINAGGEVFTVNDFKIK
ncbi:MAG: nuclear transport factor 2 family protein [Bacteroides sp.]|nr:nuclear transport factor 2 family protein [Bacteroides sp.]